MYPQRSVMTCGLATALEPPHFNHAPVRGAIGASFSRRSRAGSFNPRTRVGCDVQLLDLATKRRVSIHAPAWGATTRRMRRRRLRRRFNPRTRVGCDNATNATTTITATFQSTHPRGVRLSVYMQGLSRMWFQSTHPRGVRHDLCGRGGTDRTGFNPRTRVGCDFSRIDEGKYRRMFQSTHPRGVRRLFLGQSFARRRVSIHAPAWGATTCSRENLRSRKVVSIHAPAWGATEGREWLDQTPVVSIHAPAWGATPVSIVRLTRSIVSIHAPAWGATLAALDAQVRQLSFNPRTRVGCDSSHLSQRRRVGMFQSTHPRGVRR